MSGDGMDHPSRVGSLRRTVTKARRKTNNDSAFLQDVVVMLERAGIVTWVFGGWAEEMRGLRPAGPHKDVDLLYPAPSFDVVDLWLLGEPLAAEITAKHLPHKRAFDWQGVMVELFLVEVAGSKLCTTFWSSEVFDWPADTLSENGTHLRTASEAALNVYRAHYAQLRRA